MRFDGTDTALMVLPGPEDGEGEDFLTAFKRVYKSEFGFLLETKNIIVDDIRVRSYTQTGVFAKEHADIRGFVVAILHRFAGLGKPSIRSGRQSSKSSRRWKSARKILPLLTPRILSTLTG